MAVSDIQATVLANSGNTPTANSVEDAQRYVAASIPKDLLKWSQNASSASTDGSAISFTSTDSIIDVQRNGYSCKEIPLSESAFALSSSSLKKATSTHPVWYHKQGAVHFAPVTDGSNAGYVFYVDHSKIDDSSDLRNIVINYTTSKEFSRLASDNLPSFSSITPPVSPTLSDKEVSFSTAVPTYVKPILTLTTFPTLDWTLPFKPVPPVINADTSTTGGAEVDTTKLATAPTYLPPVMQSPDWSDVENWITTEEDSEMLSSRVQAIQAQIGEYQSRLSQSQAAFTKENTEYQAKLQIALQDASQANTGDGSLVGKYNSELQSYQAEVSSIIQNNSNQISEWQQENALKLQKHNSDIQNELNQFNRDNNEYQLELKISIQNAQLSESGDAQKLQKHSQELQDYQLAINKKLNQLQNIQHYERESDKYYKWAQSEIQQYIGNNSKMIAATMSQNQQQRR